MDLINEFEKDDDVLYRLSESTRLAESEARQKGLSRDSREDIRDIRSEKKALMD